MQPQALDGGRGRNVAAQQISSPRRPTDMEPERWHRRRLTRSSRERMWAGVAGGLAEYFDVDPTLMRLMWVVATVVTAGLFVAVYFVMWVIMPLDSDLPEGTEAPTPEEPPSGASASSDTAGWEPAGGAPPSFRRRGS